MRQNPSNTKKMDTNESECTSNDYYNHTEGREKRMNPPMEFMNTVFGYTSSVWSRVGCGEGKLSSRLVFCCVM